MAVENASKDFVENIYERDVSGTEHDIDGSRKIIYVVFRREENNSKNNTGYLRRVRDDPRIIKYRTKTLTTLSKSIRSSDAHTRLHFCP